MIVLAATGMSGRLLVSLRLHSLTVCFTSEYAQSSNAIDVVSWVSARAQFRLCRHLATLLSAAQTGLCTVLTMLRIMPLAFPAACVTYVCTNRADLRREL